VQFQQYRLYLYRRPPLLNHHSYTRVQQPDMHMDMIFSYAFTHMTGLFTSSYQSVIVHTRYTIIGYRLESVGTQWCGVWCA